MNSLRALTVITLFLSAPFTFGQTVSLLDLLPYSSGQTSTLESPTGFTLEFSGTTVGFNWTATHPALEGIRQRFRLNQSQGLSQLGEDGVAAGTGLNVYIETFDPAFLLFLSTTQLGATLTRNGAYRGQEGFDTWQGTVQNTATAEATESITTPAGVFDTVRFKMVSEWMETGTGFTAEGTTTQTWWLASGVGAVRVRYEFSETVQETGEPSEFEEGELEFLLTASSLLEPPTIVTQPAGLNIFTGQEARFQVAATGPGTLTYQWLKDDAAIPGATQFTYLIPSAQLADGGIYKVEVTNHNGTTTSDGATLTVEDAPIVNIPDPGLKLGILIALGRGNGEVNQAEMQSLTMLTMEGRNIADLTGLEFATNLTHLHLKDNRITDLTPLAGLTNLISLRLPTNQITDISPLAGLTNLTSLRLQTNQITDIAPVAGLVNLGSLDLTENQISNIDPIANLTQLSNLHVSENQIADISVLENLPNLVVISFNSNAISDLSPIRNITRLQAVGFYDNDIRDVDALTNLLNLKSVGLGVNQISDVSPIANHQFIEFLGLDNNQIDDISMLGPYPRIRSVTVHNNFLDVAPGSDNRTVIDAWLALRAFVQFEPQNVPVAASRLTVAPAAVNGMLQLTWVSETGVQYEVEATSDGESWSPAGAGPLTGNGEPLMVELPIQPGQTEIFRVQATPGP